MHSAALAGLSPLEPGQLDPVSLQMAEALAADLARPAGAPSAALRPALSATAAQHDALHIHKTARGQPLSAYRQGGTCDDSETPVSWARGWGSMVSAALCIADIKHRAQAVLASLTGVLRPPQLQQQHGEGRAHPLVLQSWPSCNLERSGSTASQQAAVALVRHLANTFVLQPPVERPSWRPGRMSGPVTKTVRW